MKKLEEMSKDELKNVIRLGRKEFLAAPDRVEMTTQLLTYPEFRGIDKPKTVNDYFSSKSHAATYNQFLTAAEWIQQRVGNARFLIIVEHSLNESYV